MGGQTLFLCFLALGQGNVCGQGEMHTSPASCIHAALDKVRFSHGFFADAQALRTKAAQARRVKSGGVIQRQLQLMKAQHGRISLLSIQKIKHAYPTIKRP